MFCVIYQFKLQLNQVEKYKRCWNIITDYFIEQRGALGSSLHESSNNLWIAYSRWPDKKTRDASWPCDNKSDETLPKVVNNALLTIQMIYKDNIELEQYDEITMQLVSDKL